VHPKKRKDIARAVLHRGRYEPTETAVVLARLKPGMTVIDAGANIGHYTLIAAKAVGPAGLVVAFEPDAENHAALQANLALNAAVNAVAENLALGDAEGELALYRDEANRGGHSLIAANVRKPAGADKVRVTTLDGYAATSLMGRRVGFIKIDVQGAEAQFLAGAAQTLARDKPVLLIEFWPQGIRATGADPMRLIEGLLRLGYAMAKVEAGRPGDLLPLAGLDALAALDFSHPQAYVNLLFTPGNENGAAGR
jgi:FkbM family methyltransferase